MPRTTLAYPSPPDDPNCHLFGNLFTPHGPGPWPVCVLVYPSIWNKGTPGTCTYAAKYLSGQNPQHPLPTGATPFLCYAIWTRLLTPIQTQTTSGLYPQQLEDARRAVVFARTMANSNGKVVGVGGSSGGNELTHLCLTGAADHDRLDGVVSLSGAYDFTDRTPDPGLRKFVADVIRYVGSNSNAVLFNASPVAFVTGAATPISMYRSSIDTMPIGQQQSLSRHLTDARLTNWRATEIAGTSTTNHAFKYFSVIQADVYDWLNKVATGRI